ncbi:hypothetical protein [Nocardia sp. NPDC058666]|uniref:hypothetical protein n=1 Tax=Nocardia sp. NPDC058666 TaxID=3346587 RepID=UPI00365BC28D
MNKPDRFQLLAARAAQRSMTVRKAEERHVWELANPWRVVCTGSFENIDAWLTAAESTDRR